MQINFINAQGGGYAEDISVLDGTTIDRLFAAKMGADAEPGSYLVRVNREIVSAGHELHDGDRVTITPTKIKAGL